MKLVIVGDGPEKAQLIALSKELGVMECCEFVPYQSNVEDWLRKIDVFVLPSKTEALSNSLMEAMSCGCCVVASSVGGNPELVVSGKTGMLFEGGDVKGLTDRLRLLIDQEPLRRGLADSGRRFVQERFSRTIMADRMAEIYDDVLQFANPRVTRAEQELVELRRPQGILPSYTHTKSEEPSN